MSEQLSVKSNQSVWTNVVPSQDQAATSPNVAPQELQVGLNAVTAPNTDRTQATSTAGRNPSGAGLTSLVAPVRPKISLSQLPGAQTALDNLKAQVGVGKASYPLHLIPQANIAGVLQQLEVAEVTTLNQAVEHIMQGNLPQATSLPEFKAVPSASRSLAAVSVTTPQAQTLQNNLLTLSALTQQATGQVSFALAANYFTELLEQGAGHFSNSKAQKLVQDEIAPRLMALLAQTTTAGAEPLNSKIDSLKQTLVQTVVGDGKSAVIADLETVALLHAAISDLQEFSAQKLEQSKATAAAPDPANPAAASAQPEVIAEPKQYDFGFRVYGTKLEFDKASLSKLGSSLDPKLTGYRQCLEQALAKGQACLVACKHGNAAEAQRLFTELQGLNEPLAQKLEAQVKDSVAQWVQRTLASAFAQPDPIDVTQLKAENGAYLSQTVTNLKGLIDSSGTWPTELREQVLTKLNDLLSGQPEVAALGLDPSLPLASKLEQALGALSNLLLVASEQIDDATDFIKQFGIDATHPLGSARGGLTALANHLLAGTFIAPPSTQAYADLTTLRHIVTNLGAALQTQFPEMPATLNALMEQIEAKTDYQEKRSAFQALKATVLTIACCGEDQATLSALAQANRQVNGLSAPATSDLEQLTALLQDRSGAKFNQVLSAAIKANAANSALLERFSALAHTLEQSFEPGATLNSIKQNAQLAAHLSVIARMPIFAGITADVAPNLQNYDFWAQAQHSTNPLIKLTYQVAHEVKAEPKPENLLRLNLCLNSLTDADLMQLSQEYHDICTQGRTLSPEQLQELDAALGSELSVMRAALSVSKEFNHVLTQAAYALFAADKGIALNMQDNPKVAGKSEPGAHGANRAFYQMLPAQAQALSAELAALPRDTLSPAQQKALAGVVASLPKAGTELLESGLGNGQLGTGALGKLAQRMNFKSATRLNASVIRDLIDPSASHYEHQLRILSHALTKAADARARQAARTIQQLQLAGQTPSPELLAAAQKTAPTVQSYEEAWALFKTEIRQDPIFRSLAAQFSGDVTAQKQVMQEMFAHDLDLLGLTSAQLQRIHNYYPIADVNAIDKDKLLKQQGQTQGIMLYLVKEALIQDFADLPFDRIANLVPSYRNSLPPGTPVDPNHVWTSTELKEALLNALNTPFLQAEARALAAELYQRNASDLTQNQGAGTSTNNLKPWARLTPQEQQAALEAIFAGDDQFMYQRAALKSYARVVDDAFGAQQGSAILDQCFNEALQHKAGVLNRVDTIAGLPQDAQADFNAMLKDLRSGDTSKRKQILEAIGSANINLGLYAIMTCVHDSNVVTGQDNQVIGVKSGDELKEILDKIPASLKGNSDFRRKIDSIFSQGACHLINRKVTVLDTHAKEAVAGMLLNMRRGDSEKGAHLRAVLRAGFEDVAYLTGATNLSSVVNNYRNLGSAQLTLSNLARARDLEPTLLNQIKELPSFTDTTTPPTVALIELLPLMMARYLATPPQSGANPAGGAGAAQDAGWTMSLPEARELSGHIMAAISESDSLKKVVAGFVPHTLRSFDLQDFRQLMGHIVRLEVSQIKEGKAQQRELEQNLFTRALMNMDFDQGLTIQSNGTLNLIKLGIGTGVSAGQSVEAGGAEIEAKAVAQAEASVEAGVNFSSALTLRRNEDGTFTIEVGKDFGVSVTASASGKIGLSAGVGRAQEEGEAARPAEFSGSIGAELSLDAQVSAGVSGGGGNAITLKNAYDAALLLQRIIERKVEQGDLTQVTSFIEGEINASFETGFSASAAFSLGVEFDVGEEEETTQGEATITKTTLGPSESKSTSVSGTTQLGGQEIKYKFEDTTERAVGPIDPSSTEIGAQAQVSAGLSGERALSYRIEDDGPMRTVTRHTSGALTLQSSVGVQAAGHAIFSDDQSKTLSQVDNEYSYCLDRINNQLTEATVASTYTFANRGDLTKLLLLNGFTEQQAQNLADAIGDDAFKQKEFSSITLNRTWNQPELTAKSELRNLANYEVTSLSLNRSSEQDQRSILAKALQSEPITNILGVSYEKTSTVDTNITLDKTALDKTAPDLTPIIYPKFTSNATTADVQQERATSNAAARQASLA